MLGETSSGRGGRVAQEGFGLTDAEQGGSKEAVLGARRSCGT